MDCFGEKQKMKLIFGVLLVGVLLTLIVLSVVKLKVIPLRSGTEEKTSPVVVPSQKPEVIPIQKSEAVQLRSEIKVGLTPNMKREELKSLEGCYSITYSHQKLSSHDDGEACLRHSNLLVLGSSKHSDLIKELNPASVCMSVNHSPVSFSRVPGKTNHFLIGPVAGPHAVISARFCTGKLTCQEKCIVKKDEFMSALGVDEEDGRFVSGWESSQEMAQEDSELDEEVSALDREGGASQERTSIFSGWIEHSFSSGCK